MIIACTSRFYKDLAALTKKAKDGYYNCLPDILSVFNEYPIDSVSIMGDTLNREILPQGAHYRKIRIPNSLQSGKSGGYRLFCVCLINDDTIILLHVYPKTGRLEGESPKASDYLMYISEMVSENGNYYFLNRDSLTFEKREN
jgi:mRNA-degrading endonuclease RelE of RelBE toxin-antitoxin system